MKKPIALALLLIAFATPHPAVAFDDDVISAQYKSQDSSGDMNVLDERFHRCALKSDCSAKERIEILVAISSAMERAARQMNKTCVDKKYTGCIGPQFVETRNWYKMYGYGHEIMASMDNTSLTGKLHKPSAPDQQTAPTEDLYNRAER